MAAQYLAAQGIDVDAEMSRIQFGPSDPGEAGASTNTSPPATNACQQIDTIVNASLPGKPPGTLWDISITNDKVHSTLQHNTKNIIDSSIKPSFLNAHGALVAPSLCHPHIHLDKPYLLSHPKHSHLQIERGDFAEAMVLTNKAKNNFELDDLTERGQRLIDESVSVGVTSMRAFVEVDPIVGMKCLDAGIALKTKAKDRCEVQLCAFAQLALFSTHDDGGEDMRSLVQSAVERSAVDVLGSTPYVESSREAMQRNVEWTIELALTSNKHLDFHLDYNLDPDTEPLIWFVISALKAKSWTSRTNKSIVLGHCTRLCLFSDEEWKTLKTEIGDLPVSFVGLPTSDLFMMRTRNQTCGTLPIPRMIKEFGFNAAIGLNNVGNAFTPQGCCDPLAVASMGVGVYQAGTVKDAEVLYEGVSTRARAAIGLLEHEGKNEKNLQNLDMAEGKEADLVIFGKEKIDWRTRKSISESVYLHDGGKGRRVIKNGVLVE